MKKEDMDAFIQIMKEIHEDWTPEQVQEEFADCSTLKEAIQKRLSKLDAFFQYVEEEVKPSTE